jgi:hypothetical protein
MPYASEMLTRLCDNFFGRRKNVFPIALSLLLFAQVQAYAVNITVNASSAVTTLNNELFGQNYAVYDSSAKPSDANFAAYTAAVSAINPSLIRYPGGGYTDMMNWSSITCQYNWMPTLQESISFATASGARLQPCVNFSGQWCGSTYSHTQAVSLAAAWVTYMNKTPAAMPTTFWEVGNEQFVSGEPGFVGDNYNGGVSYGNYYADYYTAMKAVDSTIKVGAQVQYDHADFTNGVLTAIRPRASRWISVSPTAIRTIAPARALVRPRRSITPSWVPPWTWAPTRPFPSRTCSRPMVSHDRSLVDERVPLYRR